MNHPASMLPAAMQEARAKLAASLPPEPASSPSPPEPASLPPSQPSSAAAPPEPAAAPPEPAVSAELERLRAEAAKVSRLAAELERERQDREDMAARLTELEAAAKAVSQAPPPPAVEFTPEELEQYGESRTFIEKVAKAVISEFSAELDKRINERLGKLEEGVKNTSQGLQRVTDNSFVSQVKSKIPFFDEAKTHSKWQEFLSSRVPGTPITYADSIATAHKRQDVETIVEVFDSFKLKHMASKSDAAGAFAGMTSGTGGGNEPPASTAETFKMSDRAKMSEDYRMGRITYEKLQQRKAAFDKAFAEGKVELNS